MSEVGEALERERKVEAEFVAEARRTERSPKGWPAALIMFHIGMWRERLRNALSAFSEGREYAHPPVDVDEFNDGELAAGIGTPLADAAARSDRLLSEIIELYERLGDREFQWFSATTTKGAVLRNSISHARGHLGDYFEENGDIARAEKLIGDAVDELVAVSAPTYVIDAMREDPRFKSQAES